MNYSDYQKTHRMKGLKLSPSQIWKAGVAYGVRSANVDVEFICEESRTKSFHLASCLDVLKRSQFALTRYPSLQRLIAARVNAVENEFKMVKGVEGDENVGRFQKKVIQ